MACKRGWRRWAAVAFLGVALVVLVPVWLNVIFPRLERLPADLDWDLTFEGSYKVIDPATMELEEVPVVVTRAEKATGTLDGILFVGEEIYTTNAVTGERLADFDMTGELAVDRATRMHVPDYGDMRREGYWDAPAGLEEGQNFHIWTPAASSALEAEYVGTEEFRGLEVFLFKIEEYDVPLPPDPRAGGLDLEVDVVIDFMVEPLTGTPLYQRSVTTQSVIIPGVGEIPVFVGDVEFSEETVAELVDTAKNARNLLRWGKVYAPWMVAGLGASLFLLGAAMTARRLKGRGTGGASVIS